MTCEKGDEKFYVGYFKRERKEVGKLEKMVMEVKAGKDLSQRS